MSSDAAVIGILGLALLAGSAVACGEECPNVYTAMQREELEEHYDQATVLDLSIFALIVGDERAPGSTVATAGMLVWEHGQAFLVPAASRSYVYTLDRIRVNHDGVPDCLLEALDGKVVVLHGVVGQRRGRLRIDRVLILRAEPATAYLSEAANGNRTP